MRADSNDTLPVGAFSPAAETAEQRTKLAATAAMTMKRIFFITAFVWVVVRL
jgi:hypothetical protein